MKKGTKIKSSPKTGGTHAIMVTDPSTGLTFTEWQWNRQGMPGRPLTWDTPQKLNDEAMEYFAGCDRYGKPPTFAGMALFLGVTVGTIRNYSKKDNFLSVWQNINTALQAFAEGRLFSNTPVGAIFYLKNNYSEQYQDRKEIDVHQTISISQVMDAWKQKKVIEGEIIEAPPAEEGNGST